MAKILDFIMAYAWIACLIAGFVLLGLYITGRFDATPIVTTQVIENTCCEGYCMNLTGWCKEFNRQSVTCYLGEGTETFNITPSDCEPYWFASETEEGEAD